MSGSELDRVSEYLTEALLLADESGVHLLDGMLLYEGARNSLLRGEHQSAIVLIKRFATLVPKLDPFGQAAFNTIAAVAALLEKRLSDAAQHTEQAIYFSQQVGVPYADAHNQCLKAVTLHTTGNTTQAFHCLEQAAVQYENCATTATLFELTLCKALFHLDCKNHKEALSALSLALRIGKETHFKVPYLFILPWLGKLAAIALEHDIESKYVRSLIERCHLFPEVTPITLESWPWPIRIYTLGRFQLVKRGRPLSFTAKSQQKPLDLLKVLIALGGREVAEVQLTDILWQDAEGDHAHIAFTTTLHRLRRLLGIENALILRSNHLTLNAQYCWLDYWALERLINEIQPEHEENNSYGPDSVTLGKRILSLYQGHFLTDHPEACILVRQQRLHSKFVQAMCAVCERAQQVGQWQAAADICRKTLEVSPLSENVARNLMLCLQQTGQLAESLNVYQTLGQLLDQSLGVPPSDATVTLAESIKNRLRPD